MTKFRPCIDLHDGKVKQIVGGSLRDDSSGPEENFVSEEPASWFAGKFRADDLSGGHVIMLGQGNEDSAREALATWPGGFQVGGGITLGNAVEWLEAGASHVIVTSWLFDQKGSFVPERLSSLVSEVGAERIVLDLSSRRTPGGWKVAMNRWQTLTDMEINVRLLDRLGAGLADLDRDWPVYVAPSEELVEAHLGQVYRVALCHLGYLSQVYRRVHHPESRVSVETVHTPVTWHELQAGHDLVLVQAGVASAAPLACSPACLLSAAVVPAPSSEFVSPRNHAIPSVHPRCQFDYVLASESQRPADGVGSLDPAPSLGASRGVEPEDGLHPLDVLGGGIA